jgi:hypothetical protein
MMAVSIAGASMKIQTLYPNYCTVKVMILRFDPYKIFIGSKTPAGLYARQKWLNEASEQSWQKDYEEAVKELSSDRSPDGSWLQSPLETIKRLFGLHLTVRASSAGIDASIDWLLDRITLKADGIEVDCDDDLATASLRGLPFVTGRRDYFVPAAVLFLASIFGRGDDPKVLAIYRRMSDMGKKSEGRWADGASFHNIFRAMVVHPVFAKDEATVLAAKHLANSQTDSGNWEKDMPFYQTLNALAHLDLPEAEAQLEIAFERLWEYQNSDGTWSRSEPEWNTFLTIHALKNMGHL